MSRPPVLIHNVCAHVLRASTICCSMLAWPGRSSKTSRPWKTSRATGRKQLPSGRYGRLEPSCCQDRTRPDTCYSAGGAFQNKGLQRPGENPPRLAASHSSFNPPSRAAMPPPYHRMLRFAPHEKAPGDRHRTRRLWLRPLRRRSGVSPTFHRRGRHRPRVHGGGTAAVKKGERPRTATTGNAGRRGGRGRAHVGGRDGSAGGSQLPQQRRGFRRDAQARAARAAAAAGVLGEVSKRPDKKAQVSTTFREENWQCTLLGSSHEGGAFSGIPFSSGTGLGREALAVRCQQIHGTIGHTMLQVESCVRGKDFVRSGLLRTVHPRGAVLSLCCQPTPHRPHALPVSFLTM